MTRTPSPPMPMPCRWPCSARPNQPRCSRLLLQWRSASRLRLPDQRAHGQGDRVAPDLRALAIEINRGLDEEKGVLEQVRKDAKQLLRMDDAHVLQPWALATLNDLATQAQEAYTGQVNPSTGQPGGRRALGVRQSAATGCLRCAPLLLTNAIGAAVPLESGPLIRMRGPL